jgi:competence protein ComEA
LNEPASESNSSLRESPRWLLPSQQRGLAIVLAGLLLFLTWCAAKDTWFHPRVEFERIPGESLSYRLDLNEATKYELVQLPGIGPKLAEVIVADRSERGRFQTVDDLGRVKGIGPSLLAGVRPYVQVRGETGQ